MVRKKNSHSENNDRVRSSGSCAEPSPPAGRDRPEAENRADSNEQLRAEVEELRRQVRELREQKDQDEYAIRGAKWLARIADENPDPVLQVSPSGVIQYRNPASFPLCRQWNPDDARIVPPAVRQIASTARATATVIRRELTVGEHTYLITVAPAPAPEKYVNIYASDITARKRAEESLRDWAATLESRVAERTAEVEKERRRLYDVLETLPAMVCLLTPDHHIAFANRGFRDKFGDPDGRHCYEHCYGGTQPCEFCQSFEPLRTGQPHHWEVVSQDGTTIVDAYDFPFTDADGSPLILEMDLDITERKRAEARLQELNEALEQRVEERTAELREFNATLEAGVAQRTAELRQRAGQLQKLSLELTEAEERERKRLAEILHDDLQQQLAAAKFHLGLLGTYVKDNASLRELVAQAVALLKDAIEKSRRLARELSPALLSHGDFGESLEWLANQMHAKHGLVVHLQVHGPVAVSSDPVKTFLFRTAQEILFNAVKHAGVAEATVHLRRRHGRVWLGICDQGRGFDPETLRQAAGYGLLSIRERVELLGGRMKIRSVPGRGSTFLIVVPDVEVSPQAESAQGQAAPERARKPATEDTCACCWQTITRSRAQGWQPC